MTSFFALDVRLSLCWQVFELVLLSEKRGFLRPEFSSPGAKEQAWAQGCDDSTN